MIVAIDGPAGVGKSTVASTMAKTFGFFNLNSGNFYRALALKADRLKISEKDSDALENLLFNTTFSLEENSFLMDGERVDVELRKGRIDYLAPRVSAHPKVRSLINKKIRKITTDMDLICEGRDMTSEVFPNAEVKIFLDAAPEVRAERRFKERGEDKSYEQVLNETNERDRIDRNKEVGGLKIVPGALVLDTSTLTISAVCDKVEKIIRNQLEYLSN